MHSLRLVYIAKTTLVHIRTPHLRTCLSHSTSLHHFFTFDLVFHIIPMPSKTRELIAICSAYGRRLTPRHANFRPIYHPEYKALLLETTDSNDTAHPRTKTSRQGIGDQSLYWKIQCGKSVSARAVVRNWARRRVREAFREALTDRGFDFKGVPLSQDSYGLRKALQGSLVMSCNAAMLTASATQLRNDAVLIVDGLSTSTWIAKARDQRSKAMINRPRSFRR